MVERSVEKFNDFNEQVNRGGVLSSFKATEVAVTDVQFDCQLLLRHAFGLSLVLDTFPGFGWYSINLLFMFLRPFFVDDGKAGGV